MSNNTHNPSPFSRPTIINALHSNSHNTSATSTHINNAVNNSVTNTTSTHHNLTHITVGSSTTTTTQEDENGKILDWISTTTFYSQQIDLASLKAEGTGRWFLEDERVGFEEWVREGGVMCGNAGGEGGESEGESGKGKG